MSFLYAPFPSNSSGIISSLKILSDLFTRFKARIVVQTTFCRFCVKPVVDPRGGGRGDHAPQPCKNNHKKDGRQMQPHRFQFSRPLPLTRPLDPYWLNILSKARRLLQKSRHSQFIVNFPTKQLNRNWEEQKHGTKTTIIVFFLLKLH